MNGIIVTLMLVIVTALTGCVNDPDVEQGGGESAVLSQVNGATTGRIDVRGHVVNNGGSRAKDVVLTFRFFNAGTLYLEDKMQLGDIDSGSTANFSGAFFGPPVSPATFTWEYKIDWD